MVEGVIPTIKMLMVTAFIQCYTHVMKMTGGVATNEC